MLKNKTIVILSPQGWGKMWVSKHHYAIELANRGNKVYFVSPPSLDKKSHGIRFSQPVAGLDHLFEVKYSLFFPYAIRFHWKWLFNQLMYLIIRRIRKKISEPIDIVWDFTSSGYFSSLKSWYAYLNIYHPMDQIAQKIPNTKGAQVIFSVSEVILEVFNETNIPKYFINHGLGGGFLEYAYEARKNKHVYSPSSEPKIGYIGNLLIPCIDRPTFKQIILENPQVEFHFWGNYKLKNNNGDDEVLSFIGFLQNQKHVFLHGPVSPDVLVKEMSAIDIFLICYSIEKDPNNSSNSHKILEYLSTGKGVVSNYISSYSDTSVLEMLREEENSRLPKLFIEVVDNLEKINSVERRLERIEFAIDNTYANQINRIENILIKLALLS